MSLFFRSEKRSSSDHWFGVDGSSPVSAERAVHLAPVFASLRHIVDFISTLPLDSRKAEGESRRSIPLPAFITSTNEPGRSGMTAWLGQIAYGLAAHGNAVGWIIDADSFGLPTNISWLDRAAWSFASGQWYVNGQPVPSSRIVHIPWIVPPGQVLGLSPIEHYAAITRAGLSAQEYSDVKRGGGIPPSHLKNSSLELNPEQAAAIQKRAMASFSSGKPFVTGRDWSLELMTIPPNHAQFIETLKLSANQIAAIYGIDPREIGGSSGESLTYSTDESRSLNRANNMRPYLVRIERAFSRLQPRGEFTLFNVDATIRTDIKTRFEIYDLELTMGTRNVNEVRAKEDRPPVPGGDVYNVAPKTNGPAAPPQQRSEGDTP